MPPGAQREQIVSRLIVKLRNPPQSELVQPMATSRVQALSASAGVRMKSLRAMAGNASLMELDAPLRLSEAKAVAARLSRDPQVEYAEPDFMMKRSLTPTEVRYTDWQWNLRAPARTYARHDRQSAGIRCRRWCESADGLGHHYRDRRGHDSDYRHGHCQSR